MLSLLLGGLTLGAVLLAGNGAYVQETPAPGQETPADQVIEQLRGLDSLVYCAEAAGLKAVSFTYRPGSGDGDRCSFRVRYLWRKGVGDRVEFLDDGGRVLPRPPVRPQYQAQLRKFYVGTSRRLGDIVRGRTFQERYRRFRGRVVKRLVNRREEVSLILEPRSPKRIRRVEIHLDRHGLPAHWEISYLNGDHREERHSYEPRGDRYVLVSRQELFTPGTTGRKGTAQAFVATYQKIGGFYVLATIRKAVPGVAPGVKGTTELGDVRVNDDVPSFEPMK